MYEGLASYFLPTGVLEYFEVTDFAEVPTQDLEVLYTTELHIYLDERDNRTLDMNGSARYRGQVSVLRKSLVSPVA